MSPKMLRALLVLCGLVAVAFPAACSSTGSSSAVAPLPIHTPPPTGTPTAKPTPTPRPTPTPTATATGTPTPTPTPTSTSTGCSGYNQLTQPLVDAGGTLTVPAICAFENGTVTAATNDAPEGMTITFTTSVANVFGVPTPNGGTPIMYTRTELGTQQGQQVKFNDCPSCNATIVNSTLPASQTYALCAYIGTFVIQSAPDVVGSPVDGTITYASPLTAEGLKALNGFLPTGVAIDTVLTEGVPTSCTPALMRRHR